MSDPSDFCEALAILDDRTVKGQHQYLIQWGGYKNVATRERHPDTWHPEEYDSPSIDLLETYHKWTPEQTEAKVLERREIEKELTRKQAQKQEKERARKQTRKRKRESSLISSPITTATSTAPPSPVDPCARYPLRKRIRFSTARRSPSILPIPSSTRERRGSDPKPLAEDKSSSIRKRRLRRRIPDDDDNNSSLVDKDVPEFALPASAPRVSIVLEPISSPVISDAPSAVQPTNRIIPDSQSLDESTITTITGSQQQSAEYQGLPSAQSNNDLGAVDSQHLTSDSVGHSQDQDARPVSASIGGNDAVEELKDTSPCPALPPNPIVSALNLLEDKVDEEVDHLDEREVHRRSRSKSNELFHSNRPPSPPHPDLAIPSPSPNRSTLPETERQSPQIAIRPIAPVDSQETASQVTPHKLTPTLVVSSVALTKQADPEVAKSSESSEPLFFTAAEVSHPSASLRGVAKAKVIDTQETVSQATPEKSLPRPIPGPGETSLPSTYATPHVLPSVENQSLASHDFSGPSDLLKHHIMSSIEKSATPVPDFSTMDHSSSIPVPPSQLPETFITQPLPARPATPSSVGSLISREMIPIGTNSTKRRSGFMQRRAQEKEALEKQWADKAQAVREASVQMRFGSLAPASQPSLGVATQVSQDSPALAPQIRHESPVQVSSQSMLGPGIQASHLGMEVPRHALQVLKNRLESPARDAFIRTESSSHIPQSSGTVQKRQPPNPFSQPTLMETITEPLAESAKTSAGSNTIDDASADVLLTGPATLVPVSLPENVQKLYVWTYDQHGDAIQDFLNKSASTPSTLDLIQQVINQANDVCFHPDAQESGPLTQTDMSDAGQKEWDMHQSPKLAVIEGLLQAARNTEKHIALFVKSGRSMDILERFITTCGISFRRPAEHKQMNFNTPLRVTLLTPDAQNITDCADVVIGLDETFDVTVEQVSHVRRQLDDRLCPAWILVVPNSIDHVARTFPAGLVEEARTRAIVGRATQFRKQTGVNDTTPDPVKVGQQLAAVLAGSDKDASDLFHLPIIGSLPPSRQDTPVSKKRPIQDVASSSIPLVAKRTRFDASAATHVSDTTATQPTATPLTVAPAQTTIKHPAKQQSVADQQLSTLEDAATRSLISQLRLDLVASTSAITRQDVTIDKLITENEAQSREVALLRQQLDVAIASVEKANTKWTDSQTLLTNYKAKDKELREDLFISHRALRDSAVPDLVDYISLRVSANQVEPLQRKLASMEKTSEYIREQHRVASDAAASAAVDVQSLQAENERLQAAASGTTVQLRAMFEQQSLKRAHEEVEMLKQQAAQKDRLLRRLEEENRVLREKEDRRGMGANTRASSMPPTAAQAAHMISAGIQGMGKALPAAMLGSGTASALARTAVGLVGAGATRSPAAGSRTTSRAGSRQGSPAKDRGRR